MTTENTFLRETAHLIIKRVARKTAILSGIAAVAVFAVRLFLGPGERPWFLPASILFGGLLGLLNFRWLALAVERIYMKKGLTPTAANVAGAIITVLKLSVIFVVLYVVIRWNLLPIIGVAGGLSLSFLAIIWEGFALMRRREA